MLWNIPRVNLRLAYLIAAGSSTANSNNPLDSGYFDAVCETHEQAERLRFGTNAERWMAQRRAERARGKL